MRRVRSNINPISSNITRSKAHLLGCAAFLSSPEAEQAAASTKDSDLLAALAAHKQ